MMSASAATAHQRGEAGFAICDAAALATRTQALLAELSSHLGGFAADASPTRQLTAHELERLGALGDEVAELASRLAHVLGRLPLDPLVVAEQEVADAACCALADGIVDDRRALTAASFLTAAQGFPALADALLDSDAHAYWSVRVVDVLAAFRDVDTTRARQVTALAGVPQTACWGELAPERVLELAHMLRQVAAR